MKEGPEIAASLEAIMGLAACTGRLRTRPGPRDQALRHARFCYNHLAGTMGGRLHDALLAQGTVIATPTGLGLSLPGRARLIAEGIDLTALDTKRRPSAPPAWTGASAARTSAAASPPPYWACFLPAPGSTVRPTAAPPCSPAAAPRHSTPSSPHPPP